MLPCVFQLIMSERNCVVMNGEKRKNFHGEMREKGSSRKKVSRKWNGQKNRASEDLCYGRKCPFVVE